MGVIFSERLYVWGGFMSRNETLTFLGQVWRGEKFPSDKGKFNAICYALGIVHLLTCIIFFSVQYLAIGAYHFLSAYLYIVVLTVWLRKDLYYRVFLASYIEILLTSCGMTILCGWDWGFMLYVIAVCPVSFFISYSIPGMDRSLTKPTIFSAISLIVFLATRIAAVYIPLVYDKYNDSLLLSFIYLFNCLLTFTAIIIFSALFALEIRSKEKELEKHNKELKDVSSIDPLTKLLNRRSMGECLDIAVDKVKTTGELFTLAIGDIDNFKMVNDVHGHNVGDDVLKMVASTIKESLPEKAILCRWGGEEFLILIRKPEADAIADIEAVRYAITQVSTKVEKPDGYLDLSVTMTFGMTQYMHGYTIDQVIALADENLYKGKSNGKNRVVHSKTII